MDSPPNVNVLVAVLEIVLESETRMRVKTNYFQTELEVLGLQIWFLFNFLEFHTMILVMDSELKFKILFR